MKKPKQSYTAYLKELSEEELEAAPYDVYRVYIHVRQRVPMNKKEVQLIIQRYPDYFRFERKRSFSDRFKRISNLKLAREMQQIKNNPGTVHLQGEAGPESAKALHSLISKE